MLVEKYGWKIQKSLFAETNQDSTFYHTRENSKMFNITSKYFSFFNNKPPASWVAHITRDFLTCYSSSYFSPMDRANKPGTDWWSFLNIYPKMELLLFDRQGFQRLKYFIIDNDELTISKLLCNLNKFNEKR